jgi:micrococcal nuclease
VLVKLSESGWLTRRWLPLLGLVLVPATAGADCIKSVHVSGYTREDGTYVEPYVRSRPGTAHECAEIEAAGGIDHSAPDGQGSGAGTSSFEVYGLIGDSRVVGRTAPQFPPFAGTCVAVADGDTVDVKAGAAVYRIRIASIDAPELAQPFGEVAQAALSRRCLNKPVVVTPYARDRWGRIVASVDAAGVNLGQALVGSGMAWYFVDYSWDPGLAEVERIARQRGMGLWSAADPVAPWHYRAGETTP